MAMLDHWHPVLDARRLGRRPVQVRLAGRNIALFRTSTGGVGALDDCCPHRRMSLSRGSVRDDRLVCTYHGWSFDGEGQGESPGTPKLRTCATHYEARIAHGAVWVKAPSSDGPFPTFETAGYEAVGRLFHQVEAPLELVVDNFTEVEHTPTTHALLGYELERMTEVQTQVEPTPTSVRVFNAGPQKRISPFLERLFGVRTGDRFVDDWTTYFSPVHAVYDQYWVEPETDRERGLRWRIYVFFTPLDAERTALATFVYVKGMTPLHARVARCRPLYPFLLKIVDREVKLDVAMMENLADKSPHIEGMKLSRFDRVLGLHRERIDRLYRGLPSGNGAAVGSA